MAFTLFGTNAKLNQTFDSLHSSSAQSLSNTHVHDILVVIGFLTICFILFLLMIQFCVRVRHIYRTSEPKELCRKSYQHQERCPSYQKLSDAAHHSCKCLKYSCLPKFQCLQSTCQISNQSPYYEQINERRINKSICRVVTSRNTPSCVRIHLVK